MIITSCSCKPCPVVKPTFLCGADNRTYSSLCRLDYHNCIHQTSIRVTCKGFCPCKGISSFTLLSTAFIYVYIFTENEVHLRKKQRQSERLNTFMNKYKATLDKKGTTGGSLSGETKSPSLQPRLDKYTFTPQDFKFDNKHYKYIKYTKYNKVSNYIHNAYRRNKVGSY